MGVGGRGHDSSKLVGVRDVCDVKGLGYQTVYFRRWALILRSRTKGNAGVGL